MNAKLKYECTSCCTVWDKPKEAMDCCYPVNEIWLCDCGLRYRNEEQAVRSVVEVSNERMATN